METLIKTELPFGRYKHPLFDFTGKKIDCEAAIREYTLDTTVPPTCNDCGVTYVLYKKLKVGK